MQEMLTTIQRTPDVITAKGKYNISFQPYVGRWDCYGIPMERTLPSRQFPFLNGEDPLAHMMRGAVAGRETPTRPEYRIFLGTEPAPRDIRFLTYRGEYLTDAQFKEHLARHEVGHAAISRDLAVVLQRATPPGTELQYLRLMMQQAELARRDGAFPLSQLYKLATYDTPEKRFEEDLADMYAIRARTVTQNSTEWNMFKRAVLEHTPTLESLFGVVEELFAESQRP